MARILELILLVGYVYFIKKDYELKFGLKDIKLINKDLAMAFISKTIPIFCNDTLWAFGTVLYAVAYSKAGTSAIAASQIASSTENFFIMTAVCIAIGSFIIIGVLRSGGDTKYALALEMGCMWLIAIPITFISAYKGIPIYLLVALTYTEEIAKFIFGVPRALSKKRANNIVKDI